MGHAAIRAAARRLRAAEGEAALAATWARLRRRPGRQTQLAVWARALLLAHAAHLQASRGATLPGCPFGSMVDDDCCILGCEDEWLMIIHPHVPG